MADALRSPDVDAESLTARTVVLLRPSQRHRLERLARERRVSVAVLVREAIDRYLDGGPDEDERELSEALLRDFNRSMDATLTAVDRADAVLGRVLGRLDEAEHGD